MYVNVGNLRTHYVSKGSGEPILLLHGLGESTYTWRYMIDSLANCFTVYAPDLKGFGDSEKPPDDSYSINSMTDFVTGFMNVLDIGNAILVCHSFAGKIGIQTCVSFPQYCRGLVLLDCAVGEFDMLPNLRLISLKGIGKLLLRLSTRRNAIALAKTLHHDSYNITKEDIDYFNNYKRNKESRNSFYKYLREFLKDDNLTYYQLEKLDIPTLIIWGKDDMFIKAKHGELLKNRIKDARLKILENCGHNPQEDQPEMATRLIVETFGE